jgi:hypothetical protein
MNPIMPILLFIGIPAVVFGLFGIVWDVLSLYKNDSETVAESIRGEAEWKKQHHEAYEAEWKKQHHLYKERINRLEEQERDHDRKHNELFEAFPLARLYSANHECEELERFKRERKQLNETHVKHIILLAEIGALPARFRQSFLGDNNVFELD